MAWDTTQASGDTISFTDWNTMATTLTSGSNWLFNSGNKYSGWRTSGASQGLDIDWRTASGSKYSNWYSSGSKYILNYEDDTSSGVITATGFIGVISSQKISGGTIKATYISSLIYSGSHIHGTTISCQIYLGPATTGTPGGSNTYVQYNDNNSLGGDSTFFFDADEDSLYLTQSVSSQSFSGQKIRAFTVSCATYIGPSIAGETPSEWTWSEPTAVSGIQLAGVGRTSGALSIGIVDYITSTNVIAKYIASNQARENFAWSSATYPARVWYEASAQKISSVFSGSKISSGIILGKEWQTPPMLFNIGSIMLSCSQNFNIAQFDCPSDKAAYVWQAGACGSGGVGISGLNIQMLAGSSLPLLGHTATSVYKTSTQVVQVGSPLGVSSVGEHVEIRLMYSGTGTGTGLGMRYGSGFMNVSIH